MKEGNRVLQGSRLCSGRVPATQTPGTSSISVALPLSIYHLQTTSTISTTYSSTHAAPEATKTPTTIMVGTNCMRQTGYSMFRQSSKYWVHQSRSWKKPSRYSECGPNPKKIEYSQNPALVRNFIIFFQKIS